MIAAGYIQLGCLPVRTVGVAQASAGMVAVLAAAFESGPEIRQADRFGPVGAYTSDNPFPAPVQAQVSGWVFQFRR